MRHLTLEGPRNATYRRCHPYGNLLAFFIIQPLSIASAAYAGSVGSGSSDERLGVSSFADMELRVLTASKKSVHREAREILQDGP